MVPETIDFFYVTLFSVILLYLNNNYNNNTRSVQVVNFLFLSESIVLTFFFSKFPSFLSITISFSSIFFLISQNNKGNSLFSNSDLDSIFNQNVVYFFRFFGFALIFCVIAYEFFADGSFSGSDFLVICLSFILIFYNYIPIKYSRERDFLLVFLFLISVFFILPMLLYKIKYGYVGIKSEGYWYDNSTIIYYFLAKPLYLILSFLGYNVVVDGSFISFEDQVYQRFQKVHISESCAGITSIKIFISALVSYLAIEYGKITFDSFTLAITGIVVSYMANLFRMIIIVLSGHYRGIQFMEFVHQYVGWIIFTMWIYLFWTFMDSYYDRSET